MSRSFLAGFAVASVLCLMAAGDPPKAKRSGDVVKVKAVADKPNADGKQTVTITLTVEKSWHLYANPVGNEDLENSQTTVSFAGEAKPETVSIEYPKGKVVKDPLVGNYAIYEGEVVIKAVIKRPANVKGDVDVSVKLQSCSSTACLPPATVTPKLETK